MTSFLLDIWNEVCLWEVQMKWSVRVGSMFCASHIHVLHFFFLQDVIVDFSLVNSARSRDPQILLFSNFFIKNESHGTIHTFKNYFAIVFFNFQFSAVSKQTLNEDPKLEFPFKYKKFKATMKHSVHVMNFSTKNLPHKHTSKPTSRSVL